MGRKRMNNESPNTNIETLNRALLTRNKPPKASALSASLTFGWRALLKIKHVPEQLFDVTAFPIMFILMFTYLFGGALAGSTGEYLQFLLPGILAQTVVMLTMYTGLSLHNDIKKGIFDRFRSLPIWQPAVLTGALLGDALRYTIASLVIIVIGLTLGFQPEAGISGMALAVGMLLIFAFSFSWIWTAVGIVVRTQESLFTLSFIILFPLTFISNIFVEPETMPSWLETFVNVNPISILVTSLRGFMHGTITSAQVMSVLIISAGIIAVFGPITMYLFRKQK